MIADLGIAQAAGERTRPLTGAIRGSPNYMSPEHIRGGQLDGRSDQYALGCVLWECVTGRRPWDGEQVWSVVSRQLNDERPDVRSPRPEVLQRFAEAITRAVRKEREWRWPNCAEQADALRCAV